MRTVSSCGVVEPSPDITLSYFLNHQSLPISSSVSNAHAWGPLSHREMYFGWTWHWLIIDSQLGAARRRKTNWWFFPVAVLVGGARERHKPFLSRQRSLVIVLVSEKMMEALRQLGEVSGDTERRTSLDDIIKVFEDQGEDNCHVVIEEYEQDTRAVFYYELCNVVMKRWGEERKKRGREGKRLGRWERER